MANIWNAIYLGTYATELDPFEDNDPVDVDDMENSGVLVGETFGSVGDPLADHIVTITAHDLSGGAGYLDVDNDVAWDEISYDIGAGSVTEELDAVAVYDATITYFDGTTATVTATILQDISGNLFLAPETSANADTAAYEAQAIRSITIDADHRSTNFGTPGAEVVRYDTAFVCFAAGTLIRTASGPRPVQALRPGDLVQTVDHGFRPLRWVGMATVPGTGKRAAVRIRAGALGEGLPERDLLVSQQHRMMVRSKICARMFCVHEVLLPAIQLCRLPGISLVESPQITWVHIAFQQHELVFAESAPSESLYLGPELANRIGPEAMDELRAIFPSLDRPAARPPAARPIVEGPRARRLANRHARNRRQVLC